MVQIDMDGARCGRTCNLLTEAPQGRIEQCTNGHLLCSEAGDGDGTSCGSRVRAVRHPKCPVCRHGLPNTSIRALSTEQTIAALPAICHHCSSSMLRGSLRAHEEVCPRAPVLCVAAEGGGCRWTGPRAEQDAHEATCMWGRAEAPSMRTQVYIVAIMTSHISSLACHCYPPDPILAARGTTIRNSPGLGNHSSLESCSRVRYLNAYLNPSS